MTTTNPLLLLKLITLLGCGLVAGVFFAFSTFVMRALARRPSAEGIAAMQAINVTAINPWFMIALFGTGLACLVVAIASLREHQPDVVYMLIGSGIYLIGTILVTVAFNVPLNDSLATVVPGSADGADVWASYLARWTRWNHVRTLASLAAAAVFAIALSTRTGR